MNDQELAVLIAQEAGRLLAGLQEYASTLPQSDDETVRALSQDVLGSQGDEFAQRVVVNLLNAHRPDDVLLSEEAPDDLSRLGAKRVWIIDPLDGTMQFALGLPEYAVHVALWEHDSDAPGGITAAAVYLPHFQVTLSMLDDIEPDVAQVVASRDALRVLVSRSTPPPEIDRVVEALTQATGKHVELIPFGSVGAKVASIVSGSADAYVNTRGFSEWDLAAPLAIAAHHGLEVRDLAGGSFSFNREDTTIGGAIVARPELVEYIVGSLA